MTIAGIMMCVLIICLTIIIICIKKFERDAAYKRFDGLFTEAEVKKTSSDINEILSVMNI